MFTIFLAWIEAAYKRSFGDLYIATFLIDITFIGSMVALIKG